AKDLYEALSNINLSNDNNYHEEQLISKIQNVKFLDKEALNIKELLNLDVADFINNLDKIVFNTNFESSEEEYSNVQINNAESNIDKKNWNSEKKVDTILD
ncbi:12035_t:CDS:1, partial [Cetraspora pellucida]